MKKFMGLLGVVLLVGVVAVGAGEQSMEMKVLNRWVGDWKTQAVIEPSAWVPEGARLVEDSKAEWILGGQFQQEVTGSDERESRIVQRYDAKSKLYQKWTFDSNGNAGYWVGIWNEEDEVMTWSFDLGVIKGTMVDRFAGTDRYESSVVIKDAEGKVVLDIKIEHRRAGGQVK